MESYGTPEECEVASGLVTSKSIGDVTLARGKLIVFISVFLLAGESCGRVW